MKRGRYITGAPPEIDMLACICIIPINKKYIFANFENYSSKFFGINVSNVYLLVDILLFE
jgi:hypothetical protein